MKYFICVILSLLIATPLLAKDKKPKKADKSEKADKGKKKNTTEKLPGMDVADLRAKYKDSALDTIKQYRGKPHQYRGIIKSVDKSLDKYTLLLSNGLGKLIMTKDELGDDVKKRLATIGKKEVAAINVSFTGVWSRTQIAEFILTDIEGLKLGGNIAKPVKKKESKKSGDNKKGNKKKGKKKK